MRKKLILNIAVLFAVAMALLRVWQLQGLNAQVYNDGKDCMLTSNPPISGRMVDGVCTPGSTSELIGGGYAIQRGDNITVRPLNCPAGTEKVLVPGGVKCARGLVDPE